MGMYASMQVSISHKTFDAIAKRYGIPETRYADNACTLNVQDVKLYGDKLEEMLQKDSLTIQETYDAHYMMLLTDHAVSYINAASFEADCLVRQGKLDPKKRRNYLRDQTRKYRVVFA